MDRSSVSWITKKGRNQSVIIMSDDLHELLLTNQQSANSHHIDISDDALVTYI